MAIHPLHVRPAVAVPRLAIGAAAVAGLMSVAHLANDALTSMLSALLPSIQARLGLSETTLAVLVAALAFSSSVMQPILGAVSDRFGARRVAAIGTAFGISVMSLITVAPDAAILFGLLILGGLGSAAFHPAATTVVGSTSGRRELRLSLYSAGGTLGLALGPLLILAAGATIGLGFTPWLILPALALGVAIFVLVPDDARRGAGGRPWFDRTLVLGPIGLLAAATTMSGIAFVTFSAGYPLYLVSERGIAPGDPILGLTLTVFSLGAGAGGILAAALTSRLSRRVLVAGTTAASVLPFLALLSIAPGTVGYFAAVAAAGALVNASVPVLLIAAHDLAPGRAAAATGMVLGLPVGVAGLLYVGIGRIQELAGMGFAMGLAFVAVIPAAILGWVVLSSNARRTDVLPTGEGTCDCAPGRGYSLPLRRR